MKIPILFIFFSCLIYAQSNSNLNKYIEIVVKNNTGLKPLEETVESYNYKIEGAKSNYYPQLNITGSYTRLSLFGEFAFPYNGKMMNIKFGTPDNYSLRATISQQIFNWGRTSKTVELNEIGENIANTNLELNRFIISYLVVPLYYSTILFKESIKIIDENIKLYQTKIDILNKRYQEGLASNFDISLIQFQINLLKSQREDLVNNINKFKISYNQLANRNYTDEFLPDAILEFEPINQTKNELLKEALISRIEFKQFKEQENLSKIQIELSKTGDKPNLNFAFNYELRNGFMPEMEKIKGNWNASLSFSYPIFDGFKTKYAVEEGMSNLKVIDSKKSDFEKNVESEIEQILSDLKSIENKISYEKEKIKHSETSLRIAEERYKNGLISATELIESQNNYSSAKLNYLQLIYNHIITKYNLYKTIGKPLY